MAFHSGSCVLAPTSVYIYGRGFKHRLELLSSRLAFPMLRTDNIPDYLKFSYRVLSGSV